MMPETRFPCFSGTYTEKFLDDAVLDLKSGLSRMFSDSDIGLPVIRSNNIKDYHLYFDDIKYWFEDDPQGAMTSSYHLRDGDILVNFINSQAQIGKSAIYHNALGRECIYTTNILSLRVKKLYSSRFIFFYFQTKKYNDFIQSITKPAVNQASFTTKDFRKMKVLFPDFTEQTKIADFLSSVDGKITLLNKQYDLLCQYKKGMMQKIFSQELRFKDENGKEFPEWDSCQLKDVATRVTRKNKENNQTILTISGRDGLVDQMTYFNKQIASKNVTGYYLINNGEFAYNKSYSQGYPMGAIKMLANYDKGVVSTLYICFKLNDNQSSSFYQHYFESGLQNRAIEKVAQEGARNHGLLNIGVNDFFDIELQIPEVDEQIKIANFLSAIDGKITAKKSELDQLKTWKQGLLQQMFV